MQRFLHYHLPFRSAGPLASALLDEVFQALLRLQDAAVLDLPGQAREMAVGTGRKCQGEQEGRHAVPLMSVLPGNMPGCMHPGYSTLQ